MRRRPTQRKRPKRSFPRRWGRRLAVALALLVPLYLVLGFYALPWLIVKAGPPVVSGWIDGRVELDGLDLDPVRLRARARGFRAFDRAGAQVLAVERARAGVSPWSLWLDEAFAVDPVEVEGVSLDLVLRPDDTFNLGDVFTLPTPGERPDLSWLPRVRLAGLDVTGVDLCYDDRLTPGATPRELSVPKLSVGTLDTGSAAATPLLLEVRGPGGEDAVRARAAATLTLNPLSFRGEAEAEGLRLGTLAAAIDDHVPFPLRGGDTRARVAWELDLTPGARVATARVEELEVAGLRFGNPPPAAGALPETRFGFDRVTLRGLSVDALARRVELDEASLEGADVVVHREAGGAVPSWTP